MPTVQGVGTASGDSFACAIITKTTTITYRFEKGSVVYPTAKARKGIMEPISIKDVRLISNNNTFKQVVVMYLDTLNGLWNENELSEEGDAKDLAIAYLERIKQLIAEELLKCD